jgi:hypothetical protein
MAVTLSSQGARVDLEIRRGATFARTITYKLNNATTDITGYTFAAQIRTASGTLAATMTCAISDAANGKFNISLTPVQTATLSTADFYRWDLEVTIGSTISELMRGDVRVIDEVTA